MEHMMNLNHGFTKIEPYFLVVIKYILAFPHKSIFCIYVSTSYNIFNYFVTLEIIEYIIGWGRILKKLGICQGSWDEQWNSVSGD